MGEGSSFHENTYDDLAGHLIGWDALEGFERDTHDNNILLTCLLHRASLSLVRGANLLDQGSEGGRAPRVAEDDVMAMLDT